MGSWITYGLGTENQNLPVRSALPWSARGPSTAVELYVSAGSLSGTHICNNESEPQKLIQFIHNDRLNLADQRDQLELLEKLNRHMQQRNGDAQLESGIQAMEIAYRMQTEAPGVFDLHKESKTTLEE